jgi:apolipoprotein N-acyltransferase
VLIAHFATHSPLRRAHRYAVISLAGLGMLMVGLARILLDAHWAADVLVGFAFGAACASAGIWWETAATHMGDVAKKASPTTQGIILVLGLALGLVGCGGKSSRARPPASIRRC